MDLKCRVALEEHIRGLVGPLGLLVSGVVPCWKVEVVVVQDITAAVEECTVVAEVAPVTHQAVSGCRRKVYRQGMVT